MPLVVFNKFKSVPCVSCKLIVRAWGLIRFTFGFLVKIPQKYLWVLLIASHWEILSRFSLFVMLRLIKASGIFCLHSKVPIKAGGPVAKTNTKGWSSICGQGTRSHKPQLKILYATTKTWHNQWINSINIFFKVPISPLSVNAVALRPVLPVRTSVQPLHTSDVQAPLPRIDSGWTWAQQFF